MGLENSIQPMRPIPQPSMPSELEMLMGSEKANSIKQPFTGEVQGQGAELSVANRSNNGGLGHAVSDRMSFGYDGLSFDALFGSHYDSEKDEDYSIKEDLI